MIRFVIGPDVALRLARGDCVLQRVAWNVAERLGWPDTLDDPRGT